MDFSIINSRAIVGIDAPAITIETHLTKGMPAFIIVGLPETCIRESKDRVRSALLATDYEFPIKRIVINLAPADLPKSGSRFDLPIAISVLAASQQINSDCLDQYEFVGELGLAGELRPVAAVLPIALAAKKAGRKLIIPKENAEEAALIKDLEIYPAQHINDVCQHFCDSPAALSRYQTQTCTHEITYACDFKDIKGQQHARHALEIAASGGHSLLMSGPPGTGKTMLASRLPSILPAMTEAEALETAAIKSVSHLSETDHWQIRPFRAPHHSASNIALVGGGNPPAPGEISLSHNGILFLDELPEFNRSVLDSLRQPIESGYVIISRAAKQAQFPASFQLIAAMNPCPCGYLSDPQRECRCTPDQIQRYRAKISGPILDRIDMHIEVQRLSLREINQPSTSLPDDSKQVRERVAAAQQQQLNRAQKLNAKLTQQDIEQHCQLSQKDQRYLENAGEKLNISTRAYYRIIKVARTIADMKQQTDIEHADLLEALSYRQIW